LKRQGERIVYVDSGSTDGSVSFANENGAAVVLLDGAEPFTAARARNAGFQALRKRWPDAEYVMFIDGDCELVDGFVDDAVTVLKGDAATGVVTGRCRERAPDASVYNRLCEIEWRGEITACGGIFMARASVFREVNGFRPDVIAAEDDDFCLRVRETGKRVVRIDRDMCLHDADMRHFGQWWRRMERAGHAFAQLGELHAGYFRAERRRAWGWGFLLPALVVVTAPVTNTIKSMASVIGTVTYLPIEC